MIGQGSATRRLPGLPGVVNRKWVVKPRPVTSPDVRVICFPHAGAGAAVFMGWVDQLPPTAELCAIRFPGRENRLDEPLIDDLPSLVDRLGAVLSPLLDRPFVLFGHCSGSLVAFELARWLRAHKRPQPDLLVVSSIEAPALHPVAAPLHQLPRDELIHQVAEFGGLPPQVLEDPEMRDMVEPALRSDTRMAESADYVEEPPLEVPITVIGGLRDHLVSLESMAAWRWETSCRFSLHMLPVGHFVLDPAVALMRHELRDLEEKRG